MCESNAFLAKDGRLELIMESVGSIRPEPGGVFLKSIFGETLTLKARLVEIDLTGHKIMLEPQS